MTVITGQISCEQAIKHWSTFLPQEAIPRENLNFVVFENPLNIFRQSFFLFFFFFQPARIPCIVTQILHPHPPPSNPIFLHLVRIPHNRNIPHPSPQSIPSSNILQLATIFCKWFLAGGNFTRPVLCRGRDFFFQANANWQAKMFLG